MPFDPSLNIITLGCSKNTVDTEKILKQFKASGYKVVFDQYNFDSEIVIINTCGFINDAKEESVNTILRYAEAKRRGDIDKLFVMGCLSERYKDDLKKEIPEVEDFFGVNNPAEVIKGLSHEYKYELINERILTGPSHYAYLKISEGCDRTCSFCAIPKIRGKYISRPIEELIDEARILASEGVKEIILIAQDLSYYGLDIYKDQKLGELVKQLAKIEELEWIRLHYLYPANFPLDIIDLMINEPKLCKYIDMPVQHISDKVLRSMRRSHFGPDTRDLLSLIRTRIPDAVVRTTLIAGHPGETEADYQELLDYVKSYRFDRLGVFTYSHEENTYGGDNFDDDITDKVKQARCDEIMAVQQDISRLKNEALIGKTMKIIIDKIEGLYYIGRSEYDSPEVDQEIIIPVNNHSFKPGDFTFVKITSSAEFDMVGEVAPERK